MSEVIFDGKMISLYGKGMNVYAQIESPGTTLDEAVRRVPHLDRARRAGRRSPVRAIPIRCSPEGVTSGSLVGSAFVGGVECDHLAFRTDIVDWQIWISKGDKPMPLKYVITTKWVTGAPEYSLRLSQLENRRHRRCAVHVHAAGRRQEAGTDPRRHCRRIVTGAGGMTMARTGRKYVLRRAARHGAGRRRQLVGALPLGSFVSDAQARVGRPLTPGSVAGVARRTTRRTIRRSTVYVAALPAGCVRTSVNGVVVWRCGGVYYQPYGGRYVVVYID